MQHRPDLKRAVDRNLVHPLSNLIATAQARGGDLIRVDFDTELGCLTFFKNAQDMPAYAMLQMVDTSIGAAIGFLLRLRRHGDASSHQRQRHPPLGVMEQVCLWPGIKLPRLAMTSSPGPRRR